MVGKSEKDSCKLWWIVFEVLFDSLWIYLVGGIEMFYGDTASQN